MIVSAAGLARAAAVAWSRINASSRLMVPRLERYALAFGGPVELPPGDPYALVVDELEQLPAARA